MTGKNQLSQSFARRPCQP